MDRVARNRKEWRYFRQGGISPRGVSPPIGSTAERPVIPQGARIIGLPALPATSNVCTHLGILACRQLAQHEIGYPFFELLACDEVQLRFRGCRPRLVIAGQSAGGNHQRDENSQEHRTQTTMIGATPNHPVDYARWTLIPETRHGSAVAAQAPPGRSHDRRYAPEKWFTHDCILCPAISARAFSLS